MTISVLRPGVLTTVQDLGRTGFQHVGVVTGGAMDPVALALANALVGNSVDAAALEITILGPELVFAEETLVALCGAEFHGFPAQRPVLVPAGGKISLGRSQRGARGYLAVAGGIAVEPVLGSRSTYIPARFGGYFGRALRRGDVISLDAQASIVSRQRFAKLRRRKGNTVQWRAPMPTLPEHEPVVVHAMESQDYASFDTASQRAFFDATWKVAPESNRMGFRMSGPPLGRPEGSEILSGPICLGTVQVPASGTPIALMADHQTTGGYPRIAEIASADVPRLAQLAPGGTVRFARCSLETAVELRRDAKRRLDALMQGIEWELR